MNREARFDFRLMNSLGHLKDEEFKVAYYILNTIGMSKDKHPKIYRAVLADVCNKSERTISRITDRLDELGVIKKDIVSDGNKKYNFYSIPRQKTERNSVTDDTESVRNCVTDDTFNKSNKSNNINNIENSDKSENIEKLEEELSCGVVEKRENDIDKVKDYISQELATVQDFTGLSSTGSMLRNYIREECDIPGLEKQLDMMIKEKASAISTLQKAMA